MLTLVDGQWQRAFPERRGELDCNPENLVRLEVTRGADPSTPTPTPTPTPLPDAEPQPGEGEPEGGG